MLVLKPLSRRPIALLWTGQMMAATGSEFYMIAVVWIAVGMVGRDAGYLSAVQAAGLLAGSLFGGVVTDRWRHGATMIAADLTRMLLVLMLSLVGLFGALTPPLLTITATCVALVTAVFDPALQATLPVIAPEPGMRHATNALFDATRRTARILGPSLVALVNGILPTGQFFIVTAVTFLPSAMAVRAVTGKLDVNRQQSLSGTAAIVDSLIGGVRAVRGHVILVYGLFANMIGNITWAMGVLLGMMLYLRQVSHDPLTDYSLMMMAYGIGNLSSNLILASFKVRRPGLWLVASKIIFGLGVILLPIAHDRPLIMLIAGFAAINGPFENLAMLHIIQSEFPSHRVSQIYRLQMCAVFTGLLLAYLAAPGLFGWFGYAPVIVASGVCTLAAGIVGIGLIAHRTRMLEEAN
ncbi:MFS transporter [Caballeronia sp. dw_19]|uniref:MFS transporter n=1 Tax=Caballeronia sp. dw_19 TaxID=2719791 RepID=UPI001BD34D35|nr:MFS transporter [Caballeronia sp. dw_19]